MLDFSVAPVTFILLLLNVLVSLYALFQQHDLMDRWSFRPQRMLHHGEWYRMLTAGFLHGGIAHLAFNMIALFSFGPVLEMELGSGAFALIYFGSELAAHALTLWLQRRNSGYAAVGASGAISGVVFGYCLFYPFQMIYFFFVPMWAIVFAVLYVALSIVGAKQGQQSGNLGGVAHEAHLGGALGGLLLTVAVEPGVVPRFLGQLPL